MTIYKIDKGVPVPPPEEDPWDKYMETINALDVGDSFLLDSSDGYVCLPYFSNIPDKKFDRYFTNEGTRFFRIK